MKVYSDVRLFFSMLRCLKSLHFIICQFANMTTGVVCHYESPGWRGCMCLGLSHLFSEVIASTSIHLVTVTTAVIKQKCSFFYLQTKVIIATFLKTSVGLVLVKCIIFFLHMIFVNLKCVYFCLFLWCDLLHQYYTSAASKDF